jgi:CRP-like cAMP-binding protein
MKGSMSMAAATTLAELHRSPLFDKISAEQLATLGSFFKTKTVAAGATLFVENMAGESLYLIVRGTIKISKMLAEGDEQVMAILGPDDVLGEMAVFTGGCRSATARVAEEAHLFALHRADYEKLAELNPRLCLQLTRNIIGIFSERIRASQHEYRHMLLAALGRKG